jgi:flagella basal body P-ring formation protein FlgA
MKVTKRNVKELCSVNNCLLHGVKVLMFLVSINLYNYCFAYLDSIGIIEGTTNFLKKEIQKQHKTVDLKTISIKILNPQAIEQKICYKKVNYYFPIYSSINQKSTVTAECNDGQNNWKVYLPVSIKFFAHVVSAKKSLPKLHIINKEDLVHKKFNVLQLKDQYYADPNEIIGFTLKNSIKENTVITSNLLEKA